jgi:hypothetical protein
VKTRKDSHDAVPSDSGDLESWISGLTGGETSVRRLRKRLHENGEVAEGACAVCAGAATGETHAGHDDHERNRLTA